MDFERETGSPCLKDESLPDVAKRLAEWRQTVKLDPSHESLADPIKALKVWANRSAPVHDARSERHIEILKRVMRFGGAFESLKKEHTNARIAYPLAQNADNRHETELHWPRDVDTWPTIYGWFATARERDGHGLVLPMPDPDTSQALPSIVKTPPERHGGRRGGQRR